MSTTSETPTPATPPSNTSDAAVEIVHSPSDFVLDVEALHAHKAAMRSEVALVHCKRMGWPEDPDALSPAQLLAIRALPEWINAGTLTSPKEPA